MGKTACRNFKATGMGCAGCAARIENTLKGFGGVKSASVSFVSGRAKVEFDEGICSTERLVAAVENAGYGLVPEEEDAGDGEDGDSDNEVDAEDAVEAAEERERRSLKVKTAVSAVLSASIMLLCRTDWKYSGAAMCLLAVPAVFWCGGGFFTAAWKQILHRSCSMDTLVALSTGISFIFSVFSLAFPSFWTDRGMSPQFYFESASMVVTFVLAGRMLEKRARHQTTSAIRRLVGLRVKSVTVLYDGRPVEINMKNVHKGDILIARPGDRIAVDGTVYDGLAYIDESTFTGEPIPVGKTAGDKVYEGTAVADGSLTYCAERLGKDTRLSGIIRLVREASDSKAPVQRLVDRISAVFVPVITGISLLSFTLWCMLDPSGGLSHGILAAVTVLVIACPCALGLATPTAIAVGIGRGAETGILIRDAECLEKAAKADVVTLDKTGTLTEGHPQVTRAEFAQGAEEEEVMRSMAALETLSSHPLAKAISSYAESLYPGGKGVEAAGFSEIPGSGVEGLLSCGTGKSVKSAAGSLKFLSGCDTAVPEELKEAAEGMSGSTVWYAENGRALAVVEISDRIRESAKEGVKKLRDMGIDVVMLTGDRDAAAQKAAGELGITKVRSGMSPEDKLRYIRDLQAEGKTVAMVGDGINDSAALSQADVSIAVGGGSDVAVETAGITLETPDIRRIADAVQLSEKTMETLRGNLFWAFVYNAVGIPIAAGVLFPVNGFMLNPAVAGAAMALSSISVVTNSLLLKLRK